MDDYCRVICERKSMLWIPLVSHLYFTGDSLLERRGRQIRPVYTKCHPFIWLFIYLSPGPSQSDGMWLDWQLPKPDAFSPGLCLAPAYMEVSTDEMKEAHSWKELLHWSIEKWGKHSYCQLRCMLGTFWICASLGTLASSSRAGWESI